MTMNGTYRHLCEVPDPWFFKVLLSPAVALACKEAAARFDKKFNAQGVVEQYTLVSWGFTFLSPIVVVDGAIFRGRYQVRCEVQRRRAGVVESVHTHNTEVEMDDGVLVEVADWLPGSSMVNPAVLADCYHLAEAAAGYELEKNFGLAFCAQERHLFDTRLVAQSYEGWREEWVFADVRRGQKASVTLSFEQDIHNRVSFVICA